MILEKNNYDKNALQNQIVLITGGGGGIGIEASRALAYMGAYVIIAEIDADKGMQAQKLINEKNLNGTVDFFQIDITDEKQIDKLYEYIMDKYTRLDVLINNAAIVPMGAIDTVSISDWDLSYAVNLRAPVLLTKKFISSMRDTGGIIVFVPSAAPTPYMSAYEIFKTAQVEFCNTLCEEIDGTGIIAYSIAPGFIKTDTAVKAVEIVATSLGITTEDFYKSLEELITDAEIAGVGYAVSVVKAKQYNGKEIMSYQVLMESGLISGGKEKLRIHRLILIICHSCFRVLQMFFLTNIKIGRRKNCSKNSLYFPILKNRWGCLLRASKYKLRPCKVRFTIMSGATFWIARRCLLSGGVFMTIKLNCYKVMKRMQYNWQAIQNY